MDKVSIIVTIYNVENYLRKCIDSLLAQTYENIEIVLVDDCSTDSSAGIAKEYAKKYPEKCKFIQRENNGKSSAARNTGIRNATGEWLTFVDSDDWVTKDHITVMKAASNGMDIVINTNGYRYYDNGKICEESVSRSIETESLHKEKVALLRFSATRALWKCELFDKYNIWFPEDIFRCEEISATVPLYTMTDKIAVVHVPTYYYFQRAASLSNQNHKHVDLDFYPKTVSRMYELSNKGFENELEFHAISELMYGMVMLMVRSSRSNQDIKRHVDWFYEKYPNWKENPYISRLVKGKRMFVFAAGKKRCGLLRAMVWAWDIRIKMMMKRERSIGV